MWDRRPASKATLSRPAVGAVCGAAVARGSNPLAIILSFAGRGWPAAGLNIGSNRTTFKEKRYAGGRSSAKGAAMHRLFVAIRPPEEIRAPLIDLMEGVEG